MARGFTLVEVMIVVAVIAVAGLGVWGMMRPAQQQIDDVRLVRDLIELRDVLREQRKEELDTTPLTNVATLVERGLAPRGMVRWENRTLWTPWTDPVRIVQSLPPGDATAVLAETLAIEVSFASLSAAERRGVCERLSRRVREEFIALSIGATPIRGVSAGTRDVRAVDEDLQIQTACGSATLLQVWP